MPVDSENLRPRLRALPEPGRGATSRQRCRARGRQRRGTGADGTLKVGSKVIAGTVLARIGDGEDGVDPHINFSIRPAGRGAPRIDPKPILDGWKLLEATAIYRAKGKNPFAEQLSGAGVLLLSKEALRAPRPRRPQARICRPATGSKFAPARSTAACSRRWPTSRSEGFELTIASMLCGRHGSITTSGNISDHSFGNAVDIALINGDPVLGHQGPGTITDIAAKRCCSLQGTLVPDELISLEELRRPSFAMADHADHVHIGCRPLGGVRRSEFVQLLKPDQWQRLTDRLGEIDNPEVPTKPSPYSLPDERRGRRHAERRSAGEPRPATGLERQRESGPWDPVLRIRAVRVRRHAAVADGRYLARDGGRTARRACW